MDISAYHQASEREKRIPMKCFTCGNENQENAQFCGICGINLFSNETPVGTDLPMVGFGEAVKRGFNNYANFSGRATRAEAWWWILFTQALALALTFIDGALGIIGVPAVLQPLFRVCTIVPSLAVGVRRLHDINKTAWWLLLWGCFPMAAIGGGILLFSLFVLDNFVLLTVLGFALVIGFGLLGIVGIIILIVWAIKQGDRGPNKYGPDPRRPSPVQP